MPPCRASSHWIVLSIGLWVIVALFLVGCQDAGNSQIRRLDRQRGIKGLVLGDSLYGPIFSSHKEQAADYDPLETMVRGHVSTVGMRVELGERFLFGVERGRVVANALDGHIYAYTIRNFDIPSRRVHALEDSLIAALGQPTHVLDSVYVTNGYGNLPTSPEMSKTEVLEMAVEKELVPDSTEIDTTTSSSLRRWQGESVTLQFATGVNQGFNLGIFDRRGISTLLSIQQAIDSTLRASAFGSIRKVGNFPLLTTKQNPLIEVHESSYSGGTNYEVPYRALQSFFGVDNRTLFGTLQVIEASAQFSSSTDSLSRLIVRMDEFVDDPDSYRDEIFMTIGKVREALQPSLGDPALTTTTSTLEGEYETSYWPGNPFSVIAKEHRIVDEVSVTFDRTERVGFDLYRDHSANAWTLSAMFYLPWPQSER